MSDETPKTFGQAMAEIPLVADWFNAAELTCSTCGAKFRNPYGVGSDATCFDCEERAERRKTNAIELRAQVANLVPPEFEGKTLSLSSFRVEPDIAALDRVCDWTWQRQGGRSLYLWSRGTGTGKSHMAYALIQRELLDGRRVLAFEWTDLLGRFKATYGKRHHATSEDELDRAIEQADLVLIDDLAGDGKVNDWALGKLWEIVNGRYIQRRQLLITANFPIVSSETEREKPDVARMLGASGRRVASRLEGMCDEVQVRGGDARGQMPIPGAA